MTKEQFVEFMENRVGADIAGYAIYSDPCGITKDDTEEVIMYDSIEDAYERAVLDGVPLKEIVANLSEEGEDSEICVCDDWDIKFPLGEPRRKNNNT